MSSPALSVPRYSQHIHVSPATPRTPSPWRNSSGRLSRHLRRYLAMTWECFPLTSPSARKPKPTAASARNKSEGSCTTFHFSFLSGVTLVRQAQSSDVNSRERFGEPDLSTSRRPLVKEVRPSRSTTRTRSGNPIHVLNNCQREPSTTTRLWQFLGCTNLGFFGTAHKLSQVLLRRRVSGLNSERTFESPPEISSTTFSP